MRNTVLIILVFWSFIFAGTIDQIGKDPEQCWDELIDLIRKNPDSQLILSEGPRIAAKRRLASFESLRRAVVAENLDQFINDMSNCLDLEMDLVKETLLIFPQLRDHIQRFEKGNFEEIAVIKNLWKLGLYASAPKGFGGWLVQNFLKNPYLLDWNLVGMVRNFKNSTEVSQEIIETCLSYQKEEPLFPSLYRLFEIVNQFDKSSPVGFDTQLSQYMDLLNAVSRLEPSRLTSAELSKVVNQFDRLSLPKEEIRKRLLFLIENAKKMGMRFDHIESKDKYINDSLKQLSIPINSSKFTLIWIILMVAVCLIVLSIDRIRLSILIALGMKKAAVKTCKRILLREPSNLKIRSKLAMLYEQLGDINQAVKEYQCIKDLNKMLRSQKENNE